MTASKISAVSNGHVASDVLLLGAAGNSGRLIAAELAARGLSVRLAGRRSGPLEDLVLEVDTYAYGIIQFRLMLEGTIRSLSDRTCG